MRSSDIIKWPIADHLLFRRKFLEADDKREFLKGTMREFRASAPEGLKERYPELQAGKLPPMPKGNEVPPLPPGFVIAK